MYIYIYIYIYVCVCVCVCVWVWVYAYPFFSVPSLHMCLITHVSQVYNCKYADQCVCEGNDVVILVTAVFVARNTLDTLIYNKTCRSTLSC